MSVFYLNFSFSESFIDIPIVIFEYFVPIDCIDRLCRFSMFITISLKVVKIKEETVTGSKIH